jgi:hypothetical protein
VRCNVSKEVCKILDLLPPMFTHIYIKAVLARVLEALMSFLPLLISAHIRAEHSMCSLDLKLMSSLQKNVALSSDVGFRCLGFISWPSLTLLLLICES